MLRGNSYKCPGVKPIKQLLAWQNDIAGNRTPVSDKGRNGIFREVVIRLAEARAACRNYHEETGPSCIK